MTRILKRDRKKKGKAISEKGEREIKVQEPYDRMVKKRSEQER
jgi:hypothetical protein